ncbi:MAG: hypothetical protein WDM86_02870 [Rhizomicrobium sp.]
MGVARSIATWLGEQARAVRVAIEGGIGAAVLAIWITVWFSNGDPLIIIPALVFGTLIGWLGLATSSLSKTWKIIWALAFAIASVVNGAVIYRHTHPISISMPPLGQKKQFHSPIPPARPTPISPQANSSAPPPKPKPKPDTGTTRRHVTPSLSVTNSPGSIIAPSGNSINTIINQGQPEVFSVNEGDSFSVPAVQYCIVNVIPGKATKETDIFLPANPIKDAIVEVRFVWSLHMTTNGQPVAIYTSEPITDSNLAGVLPMPSDSKRFVYDGQQWR